MGKKKEINWIDIQFVEDTDSLAQWWSYKGKKLDIPRQYRIRLDWKNKRYTFDDVEEYPTINDLIAKGEEIKCCFPYKECDSKLYNGKRFNPQSVVNFFKKKGYNVTLDAVNHNFNAWCWDMKSGYRDEENGYHLFSPCGCNPLQFRLTTLHHTAEDWQKTYEC